MPLCTEVGIGPCHIVLEGNQILQRGAVAPYFWPMFNVAKRLDASGYHLVQR